MRLWIVSTAQRGVVPALIRWFSRGDVSHSLVVIDVPYFGAERWSVLEATARGFLPARVDLAKAGTWKRAYLYKGAEESRAFMIQLYRKFGLRYDYASILAWASVGIWNRLTGRDDRPTYRGPGRDYCSEAIALAMNLKETRLTPWQLDRALQDSAGFQSVDVDLLRAEIATPLPAPPAS